MTQITLTNDQKAQLMGWLKREKDYLLSIVSMSERILLPRVSGALEFVKNDLDYVSRLRDTLRNSGLELELTIEDIEILADVAAKNPYDNRRDFWTSISRALPS